MSNTMNFLKELAEAQQAVEQVPILRDEVRAKHEENLRLESTRTKLTENLELAQDEITNLKARIARLEVERDDASFREMATADKLDALQSKIGALVDLAQELKPAPAPEVVSEAIPETTSTEPKVDIYNPPMPYDRVDTQLDETISQPLSTIETLGDDQAHEPSTTIDPGLGFMKPIEFTDRVIETNSQPYFNRRTWEKPSGTSWDDFVAGGGEAPNWYIKPKYESQF